MEALWSQLFPALDLDEAIRLHESGELDHSRLGLSNTQEAPARQVETSIPPTRHVSPARLHDSIVSTGNLSWDDGDNGEPQLADGGMGSLIHGKGRSYHGLSSAAVYLSAIEKLCPVPIGPGLTDALTWFSAHNNGSLAWEEPWTVQGSSPEVMTTTTGDGTGFVLPPLSEVGPFIEAYFRYFRKFCLYQLC